MRYFFDTEFVEDGKTIDLLSIGIVAEDGRELYLESTEAKFKRASRWVKENVLPHLKHYTHGPHVSTTDFPSCPATTRLGMRDAIRAFCAPEKHGKPEFWAYYADYDWVVLCQLFGTMMDLPPSWPMYCRDIKQFCDDCLNPSLPKQEGVEHNALADARWNVLAFDFLDRVAAEQRVKIMENGYTIHKALGIEP